MAESRENFGFIPSWDGNPSTFLTYEKKALLYKETTKKSERYLCGPRLETRLQGKAAAATERCRTGWLSDEGGVERLLNYLRTKVARQALPDAGSRLTNFFFKVRRRRGETMTAWTMRHQREYELLQKALARVEGAGRKPRETTWSSGW